MYVWTFPNSELRIGAKSMSIVVRVYSSAGRGWASYPSEPFTNPLLIELQ
jgi:hypothetical protein